jgi:trimethylamine:corrinoid methyltransferase-like protein
MEGGLVASFEKMILDDDLLGMVTEFLTPLKLGQDELAIDAMREVGPGGHFFGCAHTQARYRNAFFAPAISDWRNYESWREAGSGLIGLRGRDKDYLAAQLTAFKDGTRPATVMHQIAKGYTPEQIDQLAAYFAAQK